MHQRRAKKKLKRQAAGSEIWRNGDGMKASGGGRKAGIMAWQHNGRSISVSINAKAANGSACNMAAAGGGRSAAENRGGNGGGMARRKNISKSEKYQQTLRSRKA